MTCGAILWTSPALAAASGKRRHARQALEMALDQWEKLGRVPQANAVRDALKMLAG